MNSCGRRPRPSHQLRPRKRTSCSGGGFTTTLDESLQYATITCDDGRTFELGPAKTLEQITAGAQLGLVAWANKEAPSEWSVSGQMTPDKFRSAIKVALGLRVPPLEIDDLQPPPTSEDRRKSSPSIQLRSGTFTISSVTTWSWLAACNGSSASGSGSGYGFVLGCLVSAARLDLVSQLSGRRDIERLLVRGVGPGGRGR